MGLEDIDYPKDLGQKTPQEKALSSILENGIEMEREDSPWIVAELHMDWAQKASNAFTPFADGNRHSVIYDLPNIYYSLQNHDIDFEVFVDHISTRDSTLFAHVTLTFLLENWSAVERLMVVSPSMKFVYPYLYGHVDEDASMLQLSIERNASIVTNDKMRSERRTYPELQETEVFNRLITYSISDEAFQLH